MVRSTPSARIFWSRKIASASPISIEMTMNSPPKIKRLFIATSQRGAANRRSYWLMPSSSYLGIRRDFVKLIQAVQAMKP